MTPMPRSTRRPLPRAYRQLTIAFAALGIAACSDSTPAAPKTPLAPPPPPPPAVQQVRVQPPVNDTSGWLALRLDGAEGLAAAGSRLTTNDPEVMVIYAERQLVLLARGLRQSVTLRLEGGPPGALSTLTVRERVDTEGEASMTDGWRISAP